MNKSNPSNSQVYDKILEEDPFINSEESSPSQLLKNQPNLGESKVEMVIQFDKNSSASLMLASHDDPLTLAKRFCFKHNIDPHVIPTLATNIRTLQNNSFNNSSYKVDRNICDDK